MLLSILGYIKRISNTLCATAHRYHILLGFHQYYILDGSAFPWKGPELIPKSGRCLFATSLQKDCSAFFVVVLFSCVAWYIFICRQRSNFSNGPIFFHGLANLPYHYRSSTGALYVNTGVSNLSSHFRNKPGKFRYIYAYR